MIFVQSDGLADSDHHHHCSRIDCIYPGYGGTGAMRGSGTATRGSGCGCSATHGSICGAAHGSALWHR
jgi:hypothetical protein